MPLKSFVKELCIVLKSLQGVNKWWIEKCNGDAAISIHASRSNQNNHNGPRIPLIRENWLEYSICGGLCQPINKYCCGILCVEFELR